MLDVLLIVAGARQRSHLRGRHSSFHMLRSRIALFRRRTVAFFSSLAFPSACYQRHWAVCRSQGHMWRLSHTRTIIRVLQRASAGDEGRMRGDSMLFVSPYAGCTPQCNGYDENRPTSSSSAGWGAVHSDGSLHDLSDVAGTHGSPFTSQEPPPVVTNGPKRQRNRSACRVAR